MRVAFSMGLLDAAATLVELARDVIGATTAAGPAPWPAGCPWADVQGLAQNADAVVAGRLLAVRARPGGMAEAWLEIDRVVRGPRGLAWNRVRVVAEDHVLRQGLVGAGSFLLFLRRYGARFQVASFRGPGLFPLDGGGLRIAGEGGSRGGRFGLEVLADRIAALPAAQVAWRAVADAQASLSEGTLFVAFAARNEGREPVLLLPPAFHFEALTARRLHEGRWDPARGWWTGVDWRFAEGALERVSPGASRAYRYAVPLDALGIGTAGSYELTFQLAADRLTAAGAEALAQRRLEQVWLGGMAERTTKIEVEA